MKWKLPVGLFFSLLLLNGALAQPDQTMTNVVYDEQLAAKLGADENGMKSYVMVILKTGPNDALVTEKDERGKLFAGHFSNMDRLSKDGKLVVAGPFIDGKPKRGLYIFAVKSIDEAEDLVKTDPTVEAGIFVYEMTKLYGSAALMQVAETHERITKPKMQ